MVKATILQRQLRSIALWVTALLPAACATDVAMKLPLPPSTVPVDAHDAVREGRYRLVEVGATVAQENLLEQIVDVTVPDAATANVADAIRHTLQHTGFVLCDSSSADTSPLGRMPLPAPHYRIGPIKLRDALRLLAGPAWVLEVDDGARRVCFLPITSERDQAPPVVSGVPNDRAALAARIAAHEAATNCLRPTEPLMDAVGDPPFIPLRIDRIGAEFRLSVASLCSGTDDVARVLRIGDVEGGWLLAHLSPNEAEFVVSGVPQRITLR